jgi:hypothetical protein
LRSPSRSSRSSCGAVIRFPCREEVVAVAPSSYCTRSEPSPTFALVSLFLMS